VLVAAEDFGNLFPTEQTFLDFMSPSPAPRHVLADRASGREDFVQHISEQTVLLSSALDIPATQLDFTLESLSRLDRAIARLGRKMKGTLEERFDPIIDPVIAYVGEVVRRLTAGQWTPRYNDECDVWEPFVTSSSGTTHAVHLLVADELLEQYPRFSLAGAVEGEILSGGARPR
jgi:hypothetical protein